MTRGDDHEREAQAITRVTAYATQAGSATLDTGEGGGNPFASALVTLAKDPALTLGALSSRLCSLTAELSGGVQTPEVTGRVLHGGWHWALEPGDRQESRQALVLVVSDYSAGRPGASLVGAARDERRISAMLARDGFSVVQGIGPTRRELLSALDEFSDRSRTADVAVLYSTGHGFQAGEVAYLVPADYPMELGFGRTSLGSHGVSVDRMARACAGRRVNLVFFAGCRTRVPGEELG